MSRPWQIGLLLAGATLFAILVHRVGAAEIWSNASQVGWLFLPIVALYGVVYACHAEAWRLLMPAARQRPSFWRTYAVTISGFSLNYVTPIVNAGGEPFRAAAVAGWLGPQSAASSVIVHRMLHTLGLLLTWLTALVLALRLLPRSAPMSAMLLVMAGLVGGGAWLLLRGHRHGVLEGGLDLLQRFPPARGLARRLESRRSLLAEMDRQIAESYHASPARFGAALGLEYLSRCLWIFEYWLICFGVSVPVNYAQAYVIGGLSSLLLNLLFVIPFELGSKEGILYLLFQLMGLDPQAGVYVAIVSRARDLIWIAGGLVLLATVRHRRPVSIPVSAMQSGTAP